MKSIFTWAAYAMLFSTIFWSQSTLAQVFTPLNGVNQINCGLNTTLCDHAGCSSDYAANANGHTIIQTIGTASVSVSGSYTLGAGDQIIIYNGAGITGTVLNTLTGNGTYSFTGTPGQEVTVRFISDGSTQGTGFSFNVSYSGACTAPGQNMNHAANLSYPCGSNLTLYDNGGPGGSYTDNVNSTVVLNNDGIGIYNFSGTYDLENGFDYVRIYAGVGTGGALLAEFSSTGNFVYSTLPGQTVTVRFSSDGSVTRTGFAMNVTHYGGCACPPNVMTATATPNVLCPGQNSQLNVLGVANPSNYMITSPAHYNLPCTGGSASGTGPVGDDVTTGPITLPFPFVFFGNTYTQFGISTNANIQFGPGPYSPTYTPTTSGIPTTSIDNLVALNFADWWAQNTGDIRWTVQGTAPNRRVVICFNNLVPYPLGSTGSFNGQIVLHEGTNVIDLIINNSSMGTDASTDDLQTQGIQDGQGVGIPTPGRNASNWTATNNVTRYTPSITYSYAWSPATFLNATNIANPLASGMTSSQTYTVTTTLGTRCTATSSVAVTVNPVPSPTITGPTTACAGQNSTLTASGGASYLWSTGATTASITVAPLVNTTYTVTATNGPCIATASRTISISGTAPTVSIANTSPTVCSGQSSTLTASGGGTYAWSTGANTASITVSPAATAVYTVTVTNAGCTNTGSTTVTLSSLTLSCPSSVTVSNCAPVVTWTQPSTLDVCATACVQAPLSSILSAFNANGASIVSSIPNRYNFSLDNGATATSIGDGGNDMYDVGNILSTNLAGSIPYTGGAVTASAAFGTGGQYFTQKVDNMFVMVADVNNISSFFTSGDNGADGSGTADGFTATITVGCQSYNMFVKRICNAFDPSINQIFLVPTGSGAAHSFPTNTNDGTHTLSNLAGVTRMYYLLVAGSSGYCYTNAELQNAATQFLSQTNAGNGTPQAAIAQIAGLPSGSSFPVGVTNNVYRATSLTGSTATCNFNVTVTEDFVINCPSNISATECNPVATWTAPVVADPCLPPCSQGSLASILAGFNTNGAAIVSSIPSRYNFSLDNGLTATSIFDGGNDMYDGGNFLNTNLAASIAYTGGSVLSSTAFGTGGQYFTQKVDNMFVMVADVNNLNNFSITGNNGADGSGTVTGITFNVTVGCNTYNVFVKRICGAGDPSINQIFIVPSGSSASQSFAASTDDTQHTLSNLSGVTRLYYMLLAGDAGYCYTNAELQNAVTQFLTQSGASVGGGSGFATVTQIAGLASGSSFPVGTNVVTYRATSATGATATCSFNVNVSPQATFTTQPLSQTACAGQTLTFPTAATNASGYQWEYRSSAAGTFGNITNGIGNAPGYLNTVNGATTTNLSLPLMTIADAVSGLQVRLRATAPNGCVTYSNIATVTVNPLPTPAINPASPAICAGQSIMLTATGGSTYAWAHGPVVANPTVSPASNTAYTVTVSTAAGCTATASRTVTVNPLPTPAITAPTSICAGQSSSLTASGGGTYLWSTGQNTATISPSPASTTAYGVTITSAAGCTASAATTVTVNSLSTAPTATPIAGTVCPNTNVVLTASGGTAGTGSNIYWYTGAGGTGALLGTGSSITVAPSSSTTYYIRREGSCNATGDVTVNVQVKTYVYALDGTSTPDYCTDNFGWHHFFVGNEIILSVQGDLSGAPAGFPVATIHDNGTYYQSAGVIPTLCNVGYSPGEERFEMNRAWNLDFGGFPQTPPYNVRFYYNPIEKANLIAAANSWMSTYSNCGYTYKYAYPDGFYWFKNTAGNYAPAQYDGLHLFGPTGSVGINYVELANVPSFSGGSGAVILVPNPLLPIDYVNFNGQNQGSINHLYWTTASEVNNARFDIERSLDGVRFEKIGEVAGHGNSASPINYRFDDLSPRIGLNYYRLRQVDFDGNAAYTRVIALEVKAQDGQYQFFPNPTKNELTYQTVLSQEDEVEIEVMDVLGRRLQIQQHQFTAGLNQLRIELRTYPAGTYFIRATFKGSQVMHQAKIVKSEE